MSRPSIDAPVFDEPREHPGFACKRVRLGRQTGSERTGLSLWEVPAGEAAYPYHWHFVFRIADAADYHLGEEAP